MPPASRAPIKGPANKPPIKPHVEEEDDEEIVEELEEAPPKKATKPPVKPPVEADDEDMDLDTVEPPKKAAGPKKVPAKKPDPLVDTIMGIYEKHMDTEGVEDAVNELCKDIAGYVRGQIALARPVRAIDTAPVPAEKGKRALSLWQKFTSIAKKSEDFEFVTTCNFTDNAVKSKGNYETHLESHVPIGTTITIGKLFQLISKHVPKAEGMAGPAIVWGLMSDSARHQLVPADEATGGTDTETKNRLTKDGKRVLFNAWSTVLKQILASDRAMAHEITVCDVTTKAAMEFVEKHAPPENLAAGSVVPFSDIIEWLNSVGAPDSKRKCVSWGMLGDSDRKALYDISL